MKCSLVVGIDCMLMGVIPGGLQESTVLEVSGVCLGAAGAFSKRVTEHVSFKD